MLTTFKLDLNGLLQDNFRKIRAALNAAYDGGGATVRGGSLRDVKAVSGDYALAVATDCERTIAVSKATTAAVVLPATAPVGAQASFVQYGAGALSFSVPGTGALRNGAGQTKTSGQYSRVTVEVLSNADGKSAEWLLAGATGA